MHVYTQEVELVWGKVCNLYTPLSREEGTLLHNKGNRIQMRNILRELFPP